MKIASLVNLSPNINNFFEELNFDVQKQISDETEYVIIDNKCDHGELFKEHVDVKFISVDKVLNKSSFLSLNGVLILSEEQLLSSYGLMYLKRFFTSTPSIRFLEDFESIYTDELSFKVSSFGVTGVYSDRVYSYFQDKDFDKVRARLVFNTVISLFSSIESSIRFPIEFEMGANNHSVGINLSMSSDEINLKDFNTRYIDFINVLSDYCSFVELSYIQELSKINLSLVVDENQQAQSCISLIDISNIRQKRKEINYTPSLELYIDEKSVQIDSLEEEIIQSDDELIDYQSLPPDKIKEEVLTKIENESGQRLDDDSELPKDYLEKEASEVIKGDSQIDSNIHKINSLSEEDKNFVSKVSGLDNEKDFALKISSSFNEEMKNEMMRVKSSGESFDLNTVMKSLISKSQGNGLIKEESKSYLESLGQDQLLEKIAAMLKLSTENSNEPDHELIDKLLKREQVFKKKAFKFEKEAKILSIEVKKNENFFKSEHSKLKRQIVAKEKLTEQLKDTLVNVSKQKEKEITALKISLENMSNNINKSDKSHQGQVAKRSSKIEEHLIKKIEQEKKTSRAMVSELSKSKLELKESQSKQQGLSNYIKKLEASVNSLKKSKADDSKRAALQNGASAKERKLEQSLRKIQTELKKSREGAAELKKSYIKIKNENTALQNKLDRSKNKKAA